MTFLANAGMPFLFVYTPAAALTLLPLILLQAWLGRRLAGLSFRRSLAVSFAANVVSTLAGVAAAPLPLLAGMRLMDTSGSSSDFARACYAVTMQAPWLFPYSGAMIYLLPLAALLLMFPFLLLSLPLQLLTARPLAGRPFRRLWRWLWLSNLAGYLVLVGLILFAYWLNPLWEWLTALLHPIASPIADLFLYGGS